MNWCIELFLVRGCFTFFLTVNSMLYWTETWQLHGHWFLHFFWPSTSLELIIAARPLNCMKGEWFLCPKWLLQFSHWGLLIMWQLTEATRSDVWNLQSQVSPCQLCFQVPPSTDDEQTYCLQCEIVCMSCTQNLDAWSILPYKEEAERRHLSKQTTTQSGCVERSQNKNAKVWWQQSFFSSLSFLALFSFVCFKFAVCVVILA